MNEPRPKLKLKSAAPERDPRRPSVRPGAPRPPAGSKPPPQRTQHPAPRPPAPPRPKPAPAPAAAPPARDTAEEGIRLSKHLSDQGLASRREADEWIAAGWVRVDGQVAVLGQRVRPHQQVEIDPAARTHQARRVTILLHKPIGYVSGQAEDGYEPAAALVTPANHWPGDPTRIPFNRAHLKGLAPAGRLDIDSTGLLVLTQDGRIARHLIGEDSKVEKEYLVRVAPIVPGSVRDDALALLNHGLELDGRPLKPAKVSWQNEDQLRFVLREGRKRQIRRMCELVGFKVLGLKRVRIGSVVLGKLPPGQWRYLGEGEKF
jgi:23S rRNA pseudouridine2604 synthase